MLLIEGRKGTWKVHDMIKNDQAPLGQQLSLKQPWIPRLLDPFQEIDALVRGEVARTGRGKSFLRQMIKLEEHTKRSMSLKIPDPTLLIDPRITRYYEEMMFYSWLENNVGPEFKGIRVFPPGFDDKEVWLWHNDAFEMANHWDPNNNASFSRNPQMFSHMVVKVGQDFVVPLPPLFTDSREHIPDDLVMTNYHVDDETGMLLLTAHVRHNPLMSWSLHELDLHQYIMDAFELGMTGLRRQFKARVKAAYDTTRLALRGHDVESLFEPHLVINLALLGPLVRQSVVQLARTINAGTFLDGEARFVQYNGLMTPPFIRLKGVDNVFPNFESLRPSVCMPGCYLVVHERPYRVILVDTVSRRVSKPFAFPRGTGQSVIL